MNITTRTLCGLLIIAGICTSVACGHRQYAKGEYINPDIIILRSDKFVETDLKIIAQRLTESLIKNSKIDSKPTVIMSKITNSTDEHIDMQSLSEKIQVQLYKAGKVNFINVKMRDKIEEEHTYVDDGFVDPEDAYERGMQAGAKYLISGNISSIKQPVGRQEIVYYKATLELTNLKTNLISWMDEVEIKKKFKKRYVGS